MQETILRDYLWKRRGLISQKEFARRLGISPDYLSRIVNGHYIPSVQIARKIEELTNGAIKWPDLLMACEALVKAKKERLSNKSLT